MRRVLLASTGLILSILVLCGAVSAETEPAFQLGFKTLADLIPNIAGQPLENERHNPENGDGLQRTTTGLMVWRKADNWTAFTNGSRTWVNGPFGVMERANEERFDWEKDPPAPAAAPEPATAMAVPRPPVPQPVAPAELAHPRRTYDVDVKAMDIYAAGPGASAKELMTSINQEWSSQWGWKPSRPTTVYLYSDGYKLADGVAEISGESISARDREFIARNVAGIALDKDVLTGGYAVAMNLGYRWGTPGWEAETKTVLVHEYTHVMQQDVAGDAGPIWFREGMAELMAYVRAQNSPYLKSRTRFVAKANNQGWLPTISQLESNWHEIATSSPEAGQIAYGVSYLAVKFLADKIGGLPLLQVLEKVAGGQDFDAALLITTGYSVERLDAEYRATIPSY